MQPLIFWTILPTPLWLKMRSALQPHGRPSWERFPPGKKKRKSGCCMMLLRWLVDIFRVCSVNTMEQVYIYIHVFVCKWGLLYSTWLQIHPSLKPFFLTQIDPIFLYFSLLSVKDFTHGPIDVSVESFQSCQKEIHNKSWRSTVKGRDDSFPIWVEHQGFPNVITKPQKWRGRFQK